MTYSHFSLFPDSPSPREFFSRKSIAARWRSGGPVITSAIIAICTVVWVIEFILRFVSPQALNAILNFGMLQPAVAAREPWTFVTSLFLHQPNSIWHILFNMLTLWCVGPFLERLMGHWSFLLLYLISGIGGGIGMEVAAALSSNYNGWLTAAYGASGAIFGLFAAMLVVYSKVGEDLRSMFIWMIINFMMPVIIPNIAWQAHVGGFIAGGLLTLLTLYGIKALLYKKPIVRFAVYSAVLFVLMVVIFFACNAVNPWSAFIG